MNILKNTAKILLVLLMVLTGVFLFVIAPGKGKDTSRFTGIYYAHRGYFDNRNGIPENSLPAFERAIEKGFGVELDIQLSQDGVPMIFHDATLERMCGVEGNIWDYTAQQLQEMKLLGTDHTIPTLEQALTLIDGRAVLLVEYKMDRVDTAVCEESEKLLGQYTGEYCIQSFDSRVLMWYKSNVPDVVRGQLSDEFWNDEKYNGKPLYLALSYLVGNVVTRPDFISYGFESQDNLALNLCRFMGADAACWTLRSPADYETVKGNFDM